MLAFLTWDKVRRSSQSSKRETSNKREHKIKMTPALIICSFWCYLLYVINSQRSNRLVNKLQVPVLTVVQRYHPCLVAHFQDSIFHGGLVVSSLILLCKKSDLSEDHSFEKHWFDRGGQQAWYKRMHVQKGTRLFAVVINVKPKEKRKEKTSNILSSVQMQID